MIKKNKARCSITIKSNICCILIFMVCLLTHSQTKKENNTASFLSDIFQMLENKETDKFFETFYFKLKNQIPKEQVHLFLGDLYNNPNFETRLTNFKTLKIRKTIEIENNSYTIVEYAAENKISFYKHAQTEFIENIKKNAEKLYKDTYSYDEANKIITTKKYFKILVVHENNIWSHIPGLDSLKPYLKQFIDEEIVVKIINTDS